MAQKRQAEDEPDRQELAARKSRKKRSSLPKQGGWIVSKGVGGCVLDIEALFSVDGEFLIISYADSVRVFSTRNQLLYRTLDVSLGRVTSVALSATEASEVFISTDAGRLEKWNWQSGERANSFDLRRPITYISAFNALNSEETDFVCTVEVTESPSDQTKGISFSEAYHVTLHSLGKSSLHTDRNRVYKSASPVHNLRVVQGGRFIIASSGQQLILGKLQQEVFSSTLENVSYTWHELTAPGEITCLDIRIRQSKKSAVDADIAIGTSSGPIHLYHNMISKFKKIIKKKEQFQPSVQKLHWHRYPVGSLKFSKDGNYLISGGQETVLCRWQLENGRREDLPHLTTSIRSITISPNGASYAILLGNNSIIIISTLDYQVTFTITGAGWGTLSQGKSPRTNHPAAVEPRSFPTKLILAVPSSVDGTEETQSTSAVYLQTLDARTGFQLQKQALTRNNATDKLSGPEGFAINEPSVIHLSISQDGRWLATVERWIPPSRDQIAAHNAREREIMANSRAEIFLKFWSKNEDSGEWELSSRIDDPHAEDQHRCIEILDLISTSRGFATIGMNGRVRLWQQRYRKRNNMRIKDTNGKLLTEWLCSAAMPKPAPPFVDGKFSQLITAKIAESEDGSLLASVLKYRDMTTIRMVKTDDHSVLSSRSDVPVHALHGVAILERYLVILSEHLLVWDIVMDKLSFAYALKCASKLKSLPSKALTGSLHLATNHYGTFGDGKFAVAVPNGTGEKTQIAIFDTKSSDPLALHQITTPVKGLFPTPSEQGFTLMTGQSQIHQLAPPSIDVATLQSDEQTQSPTLVHRPMKDLTIGKSVELSEVFDEYETAAGESHFSISSRPTITQSKLAEIFESASTEGMYDDVSGMFEKVADLVIGRKPGPILA